MKAKGQINKEDTEKITDILELEGEKGLNVMVRDPALNVLFVENRDTLKRNAMEGKNGWN